MKYQDLYNILNENTIVQDRMQYFEFIREHLYKYQHLCVGMHNSPFNYSLIEKESEFPLGTPSGIYGWQTNNMFDAANIDEHWVSRPVINVFTIKETSKYKFLDDDVIYCKFDKQAFELSKGDDLKHPKIFRELLLANGIGCLRTDQFEGRQYCGLIKDCIQPIQSFNNTLDVKLWYAILDAIHQCKSKHNDEMIFSIIENIVSAK